MREHQTADEIAVGARMIRGYPGNGMKSIVILEGKTDRPVFESLIDIDVCIVIIAYNKDKAIQALKLLEADLLGVLAIVDADFDGLEEIKSGSPNLLLTDKHDIETMILSSPALEKLVAQYIDGDRRKNCLEVTELLLMTGVSIGHLRWLSEKKGLRLNFKHLPISKFLHPPDFRLDVEALINYVIGKSAITDELDSGELKAEVERHYSESYDPWCICQGHDLVDILVVILQHKRNRGNWQNSDIERKLIAKDLYLAYEYSHFQSTRLHLSIVEWEDTNAPFRVLRTVSVS